MISSQASLDPEPLPDGSNGLSKPSYTYIARLSVGMKECLQKLGATNVTNTKLERWAVLIHESMSIASRNYHSVKHVFDLAEDQFDPILILSAYFHDLVYHQIDGGFSEEQDRILANVITQEGSDMFLNTDIDGDTLLQIVARIFGLSPGQELKGGINEFLSAVIACRELQEVLEVKLLVQIACCIEATIPFRFPNDEGKTPMDQLYERLHDANQEFKLDLSEDEVVSAVQRATRLGNQDVANFSTTDRAWFLDNTWSLLPETNESLRHQFSYTVKDFQHAVFKMDGFFNFLKPSLVFNEFRGVPNKEELELMTKEATRNLEIGKRYVAAKLLSVSLVAAMAALTGGDAPMALFMGDLPSRHHRSQRLEDMLPGRQAQEPVDLDDDVYAILKNGRTNETSFDVRQSPLATFLYGWLGDALVSKILKDNRPVYPMDPEKAWKLLAALPREPLSIVADKMSLIALSRAEKIRRVMTKLPELEEPIS